MLMDCVGPSLDRHSFRQIRPRARHAIRLPPCAGLRFGAFGAAFSDWFLLTYRKRPLSVLAAGACLHRWSAMPHFRERRFRDPFDACALALNLSNQGLP